MSVAKTLMVLCASFITLTCHAKEPYMSDTKTYCIGRYLVDVPADAEINGQSYDYKYGRIESSAVVDEVGFQRQMAHREEELRAGKQKDGYKLKGVLRAAPTTWIFELQQQLLMGPSVGFEAHKWIDGQAFELAQEDTLDERYEQIITIVKTDVFPSLRARHAQEIPTEPGYCLKAGFIANDGRTSQFEDAAISFKFAQWPGVLVSIETMTVTKLGQPSLLQRVDSGEAPDAFRNLVSQIRLLRRGPRTINGRAGEEILSTLPTDGGYRLHQFRWEADGTEVSNGLKPTITVELESGMTQENGVPTRPLLTDEQAIALFDAVANSVRLRSVTAAKAPEIQDSPVKH
ncbi:hypothetical protein C9I57_10345 [Trinickia symbiotica]|uniref:Tle cognate immunity protein 4 C-terminal domain-containing protein n=1 Tax=Trinickia symbiotica TaxID=863227 RepID=A0A2T3XX63_9BURK|nr:T6SS immunity protein Tli4 family protein [Trinickia symbiotica]PTB21100.1 hypothetical protein C9I57_10345 [Trinickia symbiotica]